MDYLSRIHIFVEVVQHRSFIGAAKHLGITSSAVSKQIRNLEQELQVKLLNRTTRQVSLTEEGALFFGRAQRALEDIAEATEELNDLKTTPKGLLRVTLPLALGLQYLKTPIAEFARLYPDVIMDVHFDDRQVNLIDEKYDLALRIGALKDSTLVAKKLSPMSVCLATSPSYLKHNPPIRSPDDLRHHNVFEYTFHTENHEWRYKDENGNIQSVSLNSRFHCDSVDMMKEAAAQGVGIFLAPRIFVQQDLNAGTLVSILNQYETQPVRNLYAVFPPNRYHSRRLRLFIDHIEAYCRQQFG